jgi:hypothetical protein
VLLCAPGLAASQVSTSTQYWAFKPLPTGAIPTVKDKRWPNSPIDHFVLARLEEKGLAPAPPADKAALLRRATFDLHGLPPAPGEIDAFVADNSADAFAKVVDRLLASPRYGERWARHWLDLARFAESHGFEYDRMRDNAWPYRDYVIRSLNDDKPYARFIKEQIAGDALEAASHDGIAATGFLVAGPFDQAGNTSASSLLKARIREEELEDMIAAVGQTFLGLTVNCARCHDHKFDPIPQADYYRMKAAFDGVRHGDRPLLTAAEMKSRDTQVEQINDRIRALEKNIAGLEEAGRQRAAAAARNGKVQDEIAASARTKPLVVTPQDMEAALSKEEREQRQAWQVELATQHRALKAVPPPAQVYAANSKQPEPTFVLARGDVEKQKEQVTAGGLSAVWSMPSDFGLAADAPEGLRRVKLAEWIASTNNPLTARVLVNRVWHHHFGRGIVGTPNDLGANGERPSHPELLDWLAREFIAQGGSLKKLHGLIMLSATYQQASSREVISRPVISKSAFKGGPRSKSAPTGLLNTSLLLTDPWQRGSATDAEDRLLWHFPLRRLEAEAVRDAMLSVSGQLNSEVGGPSFRPFTVFVSNSHFYNLTDPTGPEYNRRTIYRAVVHSGKDPLLDSLDCPDPSTKTPVRGMTTTPIQALGMMNNAFVQRQARHFADRLKREAGETASVQIELGYRLAFGRRPDAEELARTLELARRDGMESVCWVLFNASEFVYVK